ncbi:Mu transposase C-terminal domain-containing protein [Pseudomonas jessenii]|uniref:Mu transposase C-terminal domain-containing protein n=1 Tax=Pseudomonas jessenii TaxID=77298 RepID=UPI0032E47041
MPIKITPGMQVVAKGKISIIQKAVDFHTVEVLFVSSGVVQVVKLDDIEFFTQPDEDGVVSFSTLRARDATLEDLEEAATRFDIIKQLMRGETTIAEAAIQLGVTKNHLYKLKKNYEEDIGSISMLPDKRGRKYGSTFLSEEVERTISSSIKKIYTTRGVTYSAVWKEVEITCKEKCLPVPSRKAVTSRIKSALSESERDRITLGPDAANQKHQARPGKLKTEYPLAWVEMDHTLVDVLLLADDRIHIIGRPWFTVVVDVYSRVILGYYLSLHVPSAVSVACALTHAVLRKDEFVKSLGLKVDDFPFHGVPTVVYMDNATEFKSVKLQSGCHLFGIDARYRPIGKKHYGGHVERLIGTMMTSKVHLLRGTTMSNAVARRNLNSEKQATMTFSDFCAWFAREVILYNSTVHSELKASPKKVWLNHFAPTGGCPFPPQVTDSHQFKLHFMPEETRAIQPSGIEFKNRYYWDPVLTEFVGLKNVLVKYDPFSMRQIWIKIEGVFYPIRTSDLTLPDFTYEEYRASQFYASPVHAGSLDYPEATSHYREKQKIEVNSKKLTKLARRKDAAAKAYVSAYPESAAENVQKTKKERPNYSKTPGKFISEE